MQLTTCRKKRKKKQANIEIPQEHQNLAISEKLVEELITKKLESVIVSLHSEFQQKLEAQAIAIRGEFTAKISSMQEEINELKKLNKELLLKTQEIEQISKANKRPEVRDQDVNPFEESKKFTDNDNQKPDAQPSYNAAFPDEVRKEPQIIPAGAKYEYKLTLLNTGRQPWPKNTVLECISGRYAGDTQYVGAILPEDKKIVVLELHAPEKTKGKVQSIWILRYIDGTTQQHEYFGPQLQHVIIVEEPKHIDGGDSGNINSII